MARIWYRMAQFWHTLRAPLWPIDHAYAAAHLMPELLELFKSMSRAEQQHSVALCKTLEARGITEVDAQTAALLHDCGKSSASLFLWDRVLVVLGEWLWPRHAARWAAAECPRGLTRGFVIRRRHAEWGATLAERAGASPRAVALIREHHRATENSMPFEEALGADFGAVLDVLQRFDDT